MRRRGLRRLGTAGFTFVEVLAALLFLAIVVPAIVTGLTVSNRASVMSERHAIAGELAENKLNEFLLNDTWATASATRGDFGADWPGYRWELNTADWQGDTVNRMTELTMDVFFMVQGREYSVRLSTLATQLNSQSSQSSQGSQTSQSQ